MKLAQTDLRSIAVFRAVADHRGFLGAQIELGLSQSAVSFHIKALEERLGFRLCNRGRGGFELTDRGAIVLERAKALFLSLNAFETEMGLLRNRIVGTLRLGLVDNTLTDPGLPMPKVIGRIRQLAPEAQIELHVDTPDALGQGLAKGELDVAILPEAGQVPGVRFSRLRDEIHQLYCGRSHPLQPRVRAVAAEDGAQVAALRAAVAAHDFVIRPYASLRELQHLPDAKVGARAANIEAQAMFILSGQYLGYLPAHFAQGHVASGELVPILPQALAIRSPFVLGTRGRERASALLDLFVRELVAALSERMHREA